MKYQRHIIAGCLAAATVAVFSCSDQQSPISAGQISSAQTDDGGATTDAGGGGTGTGTVCRTLAVCSDAQALAIASAANQAEIDEATAVLPRLSRASLRAYAQKMIDDHTKVRDAVAAAAASTTGTTATGAPETAVTPQANAISSKIQQDSRKAISELAQASDADVDRMYLDREIIDHLTTLALMENIVVPSITKSDLAVALAGTSPVIKNHEFLALQIQGTVEGQCGGQVQTTTPEGGADAGGGDGGGGDAGGGDAGGGDAGGDGG